jgi:signal transduction histidine kinase
MNRKSLRWRVTSFYVGMLALALLVFCTALYIGVGTYLTKSLEHVLYNNANSILADYVEPLDSKGKGWFVSEMSEAFPESVSDPFVRVSRGSEILYQSDDIPIQNLGADHAARNLDSIRRESTVKGQQVIVYQLIRIGPDGTETLIEAGGTTDSIRHVLRTLLFIMLLTTPVTLVAATIGGHALMSRILQPVVLLTKRAERVGRQHLGQRLPVIPTGDELERLSLALNQMIGRLEEALAHNRRFSADASHELRTPLTIIRGELEALVEMPLPAVAMNGIESALEESTRMSALVHSLMTISRLDDGGEQLERRPVNLVNVVNVTLDHMILLAEAKHVSLTHLTALPVYVTGDEMRLKQVVVNLVDNAIKYTPSGGAVTVSVSAESTRAIIKVADTGIGIPQVALPFVFDRFYRADQARSRESGGIGLGLSIVRSICTAHDGIAMVESAEGIGSIFSVELPLLSISEVRTEESSSGSDTEKDIGQERTTPRRDGQTRTIPLAR